MTNEQIMNIKLGSLRDECKRVKENCDNCAYRDACFIANSPLKPSKWSEYPDNPTEVHFSERTY